MKTKLNLIGVIENLKHYNISNISEKTTKEEKAMMNVREYLKENGLTLKELYIDESYEQIIIKVYKLNDGRFMYVDNNRVEIYDTKEICDRMLYEMGLDYPTPVTVEAKPTKEAALDRYTAYFLKIGNRIFKRLQNSLNSGWSGDQIAYGHLKEIVRRPGNGTVYKNETGIDLTDRLIPHISHRSSKRAVRIAPERMIQLTKDWIVYGIDGTDKKAAICANSNIGYITDKSGTKRGSRKAVIDLLHKNLWYVVKEFKPYKA